MNDCTAQVIKMVSAFGSNVQNVNIDEGKNRFRCVITVGG